MKFFLNGWVLLIASFLNLAGFAATKHEIDLDKSIIKWKGTKVVGSHNGTVNFQSGSLEIEDSKDTKATLPDIKSGTLIADLTTIKNEDLTSKEFNDKLVNHLKSIDFFDVEKWATAKFEFKEAKADPSKKNILNIKGLLTIRDKTHPVEFPATVTKTKEGTWQADGKMEIDRTKWDVKYNAKGTLNWETLGEKLINNEITLDISLATKPLGKKAS